MSRRHGALQNALATATYLTQLIKPCEDAGINIAAAVKLESANVLWAQGEMAASIRMLQELHQSFDAKSQLIHVGKSELLAKLVSGFDSSPNILAHKQSSGASNSRG